jgi:ElaB/YqjD/DUF883 family membrane-anchored ribosome-binding protein
MDILMTEDTEGIFDFSGDNDRRKEVRRVLKDRREMIRYELDKSDRRSNEERRKVKAATKQEDKTSIDDQDDFEEQASESVVAKIGSFFKR